jgi:hypothetical protein
MSGAGGDTLAGWRGGGGGGVNILKDARHCSVLYVHISVLCGATRQ